jgi:malonyl-CoA/methylmalonyl-CoA synthetase
MALELVTRAESYGSRVAIVAGARQYTYSDLVDASARIASSLLDGRHDLGEARVAFLVHPGFEYAAVQWGIWRAGGVAVPLPLDHPSRELEYLIEDAQVETIVAEAASGSSPRRLAVREALSAAPVPLPDVETARRAMILYTSGTTSRPKGVVTTHDNVEAQVRTLVAAWGWTSDDRTLLVLPLHHVHGIVNVLTCALWSGATCELLPRFDADASWRRIESGELTVFMAVPTVYARLVAAWRSAPSERRERMSAGCARMRLMVSGSAALPVSTLEEWREISGHVLLERYGMTEIGMALSNPLEGERVPGAVGRPLPGVDVRVVDERGDPVADGTPGEIEVRGPSVFLEYWNRPDATRESFRDGWFRTGDVAVVESGVYRILGRSSVDIIKTGGHKVSALEIEEVLREHPAIAECAVVGAPDPEWGERVCAAVVVRDGCALGLDELRAWARERLAIYKVPSWLRVVDALPRNALGKVTKPALAPSFHEEE